MNVDEYTVSDEQGKSEEKKRGTIVTKQGDPFIFYVKNTNTNTDITSTPALEVKISMPLGGTESGLFRYPRVGEKVLVVTNESSSNYLMGYIPTYNNQGTQDFQT
ncbi:MAG: hypothetical protein LBB98_12885, partial [Treponema sp.]|nr:hypothetical protein [Treponema sp.]